MSNILKSLIVGGFAFAMITQPAYAYDDRRWEHHEPRWYAGHSDIIYQPAQFYYYAAPTVAYYPQPVYPAAPVSVALIIR